VTTRPAVEHLSGSAGAFHARPVPDDAPFALWSFEVTSPAVALGSRQAPDTLDLEECARQGLDVVRRRSGGGVVLLVPGEIVWIDVVVPAGHACWSDDVRESMVRIGERWVEALGPLHPDALRVHRGGVDRTPWSELVCFAGAGPGEVFAGSRKLVGISQRRTRAVARFQCAVHRRYDAARTVSVLAAPLPPGPVPDAVGVLAADVWLDDVVERLAAALAR
jgi:lipoate---protein ligase